MSVRSTVKRLAPAWFVGLCRRWRGFGTAGASRAAAAGAGSVHGRAVSNGPRLQQYLGDHTVLTETFFNRMIYVDGRDATLAPHIIRNGSWEPWTTEVICRELKPGGTFVDIGANFGFFALLAADIVGETGRVVAFEPQSRLCELLGKSVWVNGFDSIMEVECLALSSEPGKVSLALYDGRFGWAAIDPPVPGNETIEVNCDVLPAALSRINDRRKWDLAPTVIKIDVEGFEYFVWKGAADWFAKLTNVTVIMEFTPLRYIELGDDPAAFIAAIEAAGYQIHSLDHAGAERPFRRSDVPDILARGGYIDLILRKHPGR